MDLKSLDWRSSKRLLDPKAAGDLNIFLEALPQKAGHTALIAAGVAWMSAATLGLYTTVQVQNLTKLRAELEEVESLKPFVPTIRDVPVSPKEVERFVVSLDRAYPGLSFDQRGPNLQITANSTSKFAAFREAIGHVQNGGSGWRVTMDRICVGRECKRNKLAALLKINKVSVDKPR